MYFPGAFRSSLSVSPSGTYGATSPRSGRHPRTPSVIASLKTNDKNKITLHGFPCERGIAVKRFIFIVPLIAALTACSAGSGAAAAPDLDTSFSAEAQVSYEGQECTAQIRRLERNIWEFCITDPYPVEGLVITVRGDETKLKMYDMETAADVGSNAVSMARAVVTAYEAAASDGAVVTEGYSASAVSGSSELGGYTVTFDENREPASITSDAGRLSVEITRFAPLERDTDTEVIIVE